MDTRQLRTLIAIAEGGSFAHAAETVGLTPSAVSQQILALEQEFGAALFDRATRPPKLNANGLQVLETAREFLRLEEAVKGAVRGHKVTGTLIIGSVRSSALNLLPEAIQRMHLLYPDLKVNLRVSLSANLISDVALGRLDAAVVADHMALPHALRWSPFLREPLHIIAPPGTRDMTGTDLLKTQPFIRFRSAVPLANLIDAEIARKGIVTHDIAEIDTIGAIVTCVENGLGISVVPHVALRGLAEKRLVIRPFGSPPVYRQIGLIERTVAPRGRIIEDLHEALADLSGEHGLSRRASPD